MKINKKRLRKIKKWQQKTPEGIVNPILWGVDLSGENVIPCTHCSECYFNLEENEDCDEYKIDWIIGKI